MMFGRNGRGVRSSSGGFGCWVSKVLLLLNVLGEVIEVLYNFVSYLGPYKAVRQSSCTFSTFRLSRGACLCVLLDILEGYLQLRESCYS